ncbi:MAG TPA: protein kinase, partial [Gemmataceae bacterium]|nr:protein kinase [Gemmataceae bacterium]
LREAAAVARMHHPNIVQVYEVGDDGGGRPFLALEYVPGGTLAESLRGGPAAPRVAAGLLEQVARAVHHAHERGVVHRDLKPSNILLQRTERQSASANSDLSSLTSDLIPKVSDFGLARAVTEDQSLTLPDVLVGTPAYLAPEVIRSPASPTPAGDVYALGVILYEMLTGRPPLIGPTALVTLRLVETAEPVPPTHLQPAVPRDLETVCLACLRKDPRRRYPSALALADDLRRFLDGRPIRARRVSRLEAGWLWCQRNPVVAGLAAALVVSVLTGLVAALVLLGEAHRSAADAAANAGRAGENEARALASAARADASARLANDRAYASDLQFASQMWVNRQHPVIVDLLDGQRPERTDGTDRRGFEWYYLWASAHPPHRPVPLPNQGWDLAVSREGRFIAVAARESGVVLLDPAGTVLRTLASGGGKVMRVGVSADGRRVAGGSEDGTARVWDAESGRVLYTLDGHRGPVFGVSFHPDGRLLATAGLDGTIRVRDPEDPAEPRVISRPGVRFHCVAFSPDGKWLAVGGSDATVRLWDATTWAEQPALRGHTGDVLSVAFAPDSHRLASGSRDRTARLWDAAAGKPVRVLPVHLDAVFAVAFSPDGRSLATASFDRSVVVTDPDTGLVAHTLLGHTDLAVGVGFAPDGALASTSWDQTVRLWDLAGGRPYRVWRAHAQRVRGAAFAPDGRLATASADGTVRVWDPATGTARQVLSGHTGGVVSLAFDPAGRLATAAGDGRVRVWDTAVDREPAAATGHAERVNDLRFATDGRLAGAGEGGTVYLWDAAGTGHPLTKLPSAVVCVRFDPSGQVVAAGCRDGTVMVVEAATGRWVHRFGGHGGGVTALDVSPDGRRLAVGSADRAVRIWDRESGTLTHTLRGHVRAVTAVAFSPDGRRVFSGSQDQTVRVWHAASGQPLVTLTEPDEVAALAVSPDGRAVASAGPGGSIVVRRAFPEPGPPAPDH